MGNAPWYKNKIVDRDYLKHILEEGFRRCATEDFDSALGKLTTLVERYTLIQVISNTEEIIGKAHADIGEVMESLEEMKSAVGREHIKEISAFMEEGEEKGDS